jgi:hypothetical protein
VDPQWKGAAWAPHTGALAKRRHWIVEGVPKDRYYLFGKLIMYIDKTSFQGAWDRKFDWKGELLTTYQVMSYNPQPITRPDGGSTSCGARTWLRTARPSSPNARRLRGSRAPRLGVPPARAFNESSSRSDSLAQGQVDDRRGQARMTR